MPIASANPFPSMLYVEGTTPSSPSSGQQRLFVRSSDHVLCMVNSSGTVTALSGSLTNPMTTAQDIIVGGSAGAPGRLAVGAAGGALSVVNSVLAYNSGTSMPGSKATGDRYWRTDLGMEAFWDGTRWLTTNELSTSGVTENPAAASGITATSTLVRMAALTDYDIYVTTVDVSSFVVTTNDGSHFWTLEFVKTSTANADTTITSGNTSADTHDVWTRHKLTVNTAIVSGTNPTIGVHATKTSTAGILYYSITIRFRLILT